MGDDNWAVHGRVEAVNARHVFGWVEGGEDAPPRLSLRVNGAPVARTHALTPLDRPPWGAVRAFYFNIGELWDFVGPGDRLSVWCDDHELAIDEASIDLPETPPGRSVDDLLALIQQGWVFNKKGKLQLSKLRNLPWQTEVLATFDAVRAEARAFADLALFPVYGSLLGAVRDSAFIGHDDDFDCAFVSSGATVEDVRMQLVQFGHHLIARGFQVWPGVTCLKVSRPGPTRVSIDIFHSLFDRHDRFILPFGTAGTEPYMRQDMDGAWETVRIGDHALAVPPNPAKLLAWTYGEGWRTPDPGFNWDRARRHQLKAARPTFENRATLFWNNRHARARPPGPSAFARGLGRIKTRPTAVLDLGCGVARDSLMLARLWPEARVLALDRAPSVPAAAQAYLAGRPEADRIEVRRQDVRPLGAVKEAIGAARDRAPDGPLLIYGRCLLDSIPEPLLGRVCEGMASGVRSGDVVALQWREFDPDASPGQVARGFRRRVDADFVRGVLTRGGRLRMVSERAVPPKGGEPHVVAMRRMLLKAD